MNCAMRVPKTVKVNVNGRTNLLNVRHRCGKKGHLFIRLELGSRIKYISYCKEHQSAVAMDANNPNMIAYIVDQYNEYLLKTAKKATIVDESEVPQIKRNQYKETKDRIKRIMKQKNNTKVDWDTLFDEILKEFLVESVMEG